MTETQYKQVAGSENETEKINTPSKYGYGVRHIQAFLIFMALALSYISRGHLGVTIVAMTNGTPNETKITAYNNNITDLHFNNTIVTFNNETDYDKNLQTLLRDIHNNSVHSEMGEVIRHSNDTLENNKTFVNEDSDSSIWNIYRTYHWPKSTQEMVLGAFFLGYFIMMFPTGLVVQRWGGKILLQIALFLNSVIPMTVPWLTAWGGWKVLCACRFVQGLSQAGLYPSIHTLIANWVPLSERATLNSYVYTGSGFGTILAFQVGGVLADSNWGWPSTFWVTGLMCFLGFLFVTFLGANKPVDHKSISEKEKNFIIGHFGDEKKEISKIPWKKILTSKHAWACFSGHVGSGVSFMFFFTQFPTYMHGILRFNIKTSGLLSSLPYISTFLSTIACGHLSDFCTNRKILSVKNARIISNTIGGVGPAICIALVTVTQNSTLAVVIFTTMLSFHSAGHTGWMVNYIDLAPNYSGALMAFGNTLCNSIATILPLIVSSIVTDVENPHQWRVVLLLIACLSFTANAFYVLFTSVDVQSWNDTEQNDEPQEVKLEESAEKKKVMDT